MIDSNNGFNNRGRRRYNSNFRGARRRNYGSNGAVETRGFLNFLFSFNGKISKNLFIGYIFLVAVLYSGLNIAGAFVENKIASLVLSLFSLLLFVSDIAVGIKRAHALGISGIYSVLGFVCVPFFGFNRSDRDFGNDNIYKSKFKLFKAIGNFVNRNVFTKVLYLILFFAIMFAPMIFEPSGVKGFVVATLVTVLFNVLQMLLLKFRWFRHRYTGFVKVCTFICYNLFIMGIASFFTMAYLLSRMMM